MRYLSLYGRFRKSYSTAESKYTESSSPQSVDTKSIFNHVLGLEEPMGNDNRVRRHDDAFRAEAVALVIDKKLPVSSSSRTRWCSIRDGAKLDRSFRTTSRGDLREVG